jgi:hypothetical protein
MKTVNGIRIHTIELTDQAIATIHRLATLAMAPHQALLDEIAPQLPQPPVGTPGQMQALDAQRPVGEKPDLSTVSNDH